MSRPRTAIRRMWEHGDVVSPQRDTGVIPGTYRPSYMKPNRVLVIPDNPAARKAMLDRCASVYKGFHRETIEDMLNIALDGVEEAARKEVLRQEKVRIEHMKERP